MQSEQSEQTVCGVSAGNLPIFDCPNCNDLVPLHTPVHGDVRDPPVPWHLLRPIEPPMPLQENLWQTALIQHVAILVGMQLAELRFFWATDRSFLVPTHRSVGAAGGYCAVGRIDLSSQHLGSRLSQHYNEDNNTGQ